VPRALSVSPNIVICLQQMILGPFIFHELECTKDQQPSANPGAIGGPGYRGNSILVHLHSNQGRNSHLVMESPEPLMV
jgi:hypothetical protein